MNLIKYVGGKKYLLKWLYEHFDKTDHDMFVDAFGGAGTVVLNKKEVSVEVLNDIDPIIYNLYYHCKYNSHIELLLNEIECNPDTFNKYKQVYEGFRASKTFNEQLAIATIVVRRMSRGGLGKDFSSSKRLRGGRIEEVNSWENFKINFKHIVRRFRPIHIYNRDIFDLLPEVDSPKTLVYVDCPYHPDTVKSKTYDHILTAEQHEQLLDTLNACMSKVAISGYDNELYREKLKGWRIAVKDIASHAGQTKSKKRKQEFLWMNY